MPRSRAIVIFGGFWAAMAITASAHSQGPMDRGAAAAEAPSRAGLVAADTDEPGSPASILARQEKPQAGLAGLLRPAHTPDGAALGDESCPADMVDVEGDYCPYVAQTCLRWLDPDTKLQCAEFERTADPARCASPTQHKHFCIDRYEWPNEAGALPDYMVSWNEAEAACKGIGKRLCSDTEWTLACEGEERQPYPYGDGYARDDTACNIDKPYVWPHADRLMNPKTQDEELERLDQREPSGARPACVTPYGVRDMVGNVDEWVVNESQGAKPFKSGLKGGYWGPVRTRCRPMTTAHDEGFRFYQIGFRCCEDTHDVIDVHAPLAMR